MKIGCLTEIADVKLVAWDNGYRVPLTGESKAIQSLF